jgi:hypothetical protein
MTEDKDTAMREVSIVKRTTTMTSEEFFSIQLKAPDESVESLLQKAILATTSSQPRGKEIPVTH